MQLISVQYFRALAATMVVFFHLGLQYRRMGYEGPWFEFLSSGVDIFFVISGFIMWSTTNRIATAPAEFVKKRFVRIVPLYWTISLFFVVLMLVAPYALQSEKFDLAHTISSFLFLPYPHPTLATLLPIIVPGWTLNYEMFFYAIFSLGLFLPSTPRFILTTSILLAFAVAGAKLSIGNRYFQFYTSSIVLEFSLGMTVAMACEKKVLIPPRFAYPSIVLNFAAIACLEMLWPNLPRLFAWGIPAAIMIYAVLSAELQKPIVRIFLPALIGDASYSLYLTHGIVLSAVGQLWRRLIPASSAPSYIAFTVVATVSAMVLAVLCYRLVEIPASRWLNRRLSEKRASPAVKRAGDTPAAA